MTKVAGAMQKSTQIMTMMNQLVKIPEISATMMAMSREMSKVCYTYYYCLFPHGSVGGHD
jgi:hypothetical protein